MTQFTSTIETTDVKHKRDERCMALVCSQSPSMWQDIFGRWLFSACILLIHDAHWWETHGNLLSVQRYGLKF